MKFHEISYLRHWETDFLEASTMSDVNGCGSTETAAGPTTSSFCGVHCQRPCGSKMLNWLYHINHGDEHVERSCVEKIKRNSLRCINFCQSHSQSQLHQKILAFSSIFHLRQLVHVCSTKISANYTDVSTSSPNDTKSAMVSKGNFQNYIF